MKLRGLTPAASKIILRRLYLRAYAQSILSAGQVLENSAPPL
jgi:hypothetical protein